MKKKAEPEPVKSDYLSSGSTVLNLCFTGHTRRAYRKGRYYLFVGDSESGKTKLAMTALAEAVNNPAFDDYQVVYDGPEYGAGFDIPAVFGSKLDERMEPPCGTKAYPEHSLYLEDLYDNLKDRMDKGPVVYVLDSMDSLQPEAEEKQDRKQRAVRRKRKAGKNVQEAGSYGVDKAKVNSRELKKVIPRLHKTHSILIIITQSRDLIGNQFMTFGDTKTRSGGHALKFYAHVEIWTKIKGYIKKTVRKRERELGIRALVKVKKNREQGKHRQAVIPMYHDAPMDDVGGCVEYLIDEKHWKGNDTSVKAPEFGFDGKREELVQDIEEEGLEGKLRKIVKGVWNDIESKCRVVRKKRYL